MKPSPLVTCNSCGATYAPVQADGCEYYHACAPFRVVDDGPVDAADDTKGRKVRRDPIADPRDENIAGHDDKGKPVIKHAGKGVTPVADAAAIEAFFGTQEDR
jgi:hypothetical protein